MAKKPKASRDPRTGRFVAGEGDQHAAAMQHARQHKRRSPVAPRVEKRVLDEVAEKGVRTEYRENRRAMVRRRKTLDALVEELGGAERAGASGLLLAERVARARVHLEWWDGVMHEMRRSGRLVSRRKGQVAVIVQQYEQADAAFRQWLETFDKRKSNVILERLQDELDELRETVQRNSGGRVYDQT